MRALRALAARYAGPIRAPSVAGEVREAPPRPAERGCDVLLEPSGLDEPADKVARLTS